MRASRKESVVALVVAATALLLTSVFGFLSFVPGVDAEMGSFLELAFYGSGAVTMGAFFTYVVMSRRTGSGRTPTRFDRALDQRAAAMGAIPIGLIAVLVGVLWYMARTFGAESAIGPLPGSGRFAAIDTAGIAAFLGFGCLYVIVATYLAMRAEKAALVSARHDLEVE